jgi:hypothetical protein
MNIDNLSDMQLATCVDELFKRCINSVRAAGLSTQIQLMVSATQFGADGEYEIKHRAIVGDYQKSNSSETGNLMLSVQNAAAQWLADAVHAPIKVVPMITHQQPQQEHEDELAAPVEEPAAEFTDLQVFKPEGENEAEY